MAQSAPRDPGTSPGRRRRHPEGVSVGKSIGGAATVAKPKPKGEARSGTITGKPKVARASPKAEKIAPANVKPAAKLKVAAKKMKAK